MRIAYKVKELYDGTEKMPEKARILLTEGDLVVGTAPWSADGELAGAGYEIVDYSKAFCMPGMIDAHVHSVLPGDGTAAEDFFAAHSSGEILLTTANNMNTALKNGITTVRDCGGPSEIVFEVRRAIEKGIVEGADMILCGSSLTTTGGHTHFFGGECDTPEETVKKIRSLHKQGADFVKLIATGGGTRNVIQHAQMLSDGQLEAAVNEAHRLGKIATAHVCTTATARAAFESGVDMLEHMIFADESNNIAFDEKLAEGLAKKNIPVCITMSVLPVSIARYERLGRAFTPAEQAEYDMLCRFRDTISEGFERTFRDIRYIPGTDAGWRSSSFDSLVECMAAMNGLGMSSLKTLYSATGLAAEILGVADRTGTLLPGRRADFVLLKKDPMEDIRNVTAIDTVYKSGRAVQ